MLRTLHKFFLAITSIRPRRIRHSKDQVKDFLDSFDEPLNDIERSYYQYKCQKWDTYGATQFFLSNIVSIFLYIPFFLFYRLKKTPVNKEKVQYIATAEHILKFIPKDMLSDSASSDFFKGALNKEDVTFLRRITKQYPFSFFFRFKIMCRIANYSQIISTYSPKAVFCSAEYSFTSSVLTNYCEYKGVELYNVMHGEKTYNIRDSFFRFNRFYVWDEYYKDLFFSLRANKTNYFINPIEVPKLDNYKCIHQFTYYLQDQKKEQLVKIKEILDSLKADYVVRPHPIYSPKEDVKKIFGPNNIESNEIGIWESIGSTANVISVYSTVNYQAYLAGVNVILDDVTEQAYFERLKDREYIMLYKPHELLSQLKNVK